MYQFYNLFSVPHLSLRKEIIPCGSCYSKQAIHKLKYNTSSFSSQKYSSNEGNRDSKPENLEPWSHTISQLTYMGGKWLLHLNQMLGEKNYATYLVHVSHIKQPCKESLKEVRGEQRSDNMKLSRILCNIIQELEQITNIFLPQERASHTTESSKRKSLTPTKEATKPLFLYPMLEFANKFGITTFFFSNFTGKKRRRLI